MKITDGRSYMVFENIDDGTAFDCNGSILIKLDREVKDDIGMGAIYNAVDLKTGEPHLIGDKCMVYLVNAEVVVK